MDREIKAVFVESSVPKRSIQAVVEGTKKKGHTIEIGGELFSDAMGKEGTKRALTSAWSDIMWTPLSRR